MAGGHGRRLRGRSAMVRWSRSDPGRRGERGSSPTNTAYQSTQYRVVCRAPRRPDVDAIYIATPHPQHTDVALSASRPARRFRREGFHRNGFRTLERIVTLPAARGRLCDGGDVDALQPRHRARRELVDAGAIGQVRGVQGDLTAFRTSTRGSALRTRSGRCGARPRRLRLSRAVLPRHPDVCTPMGAVPAGRRGRVRGPARL